MRTTVSRKLDSQPAVGSGGCGSRAVTCRTSDGNCRVVKDLWRKTGAAPVHHPRTRYVTRSRRRASGSESSRPRFAGYGRPPSHQDPEPNRLKPGRIAVPSIRAWRPRRPARRSSAGRSRRACSFNPSMEATPSGVKHEPHSGHIQNVLAARLPGRSWARPWSAPSHIQNVLAARLPQNPRVRTRSPPSGNDGHPSWYATPTTRGSVRSCCNA